MLTVGRVVVKLANETEPITKKIVACASLRQSCESMLYSRTAAVCGAPAQPCQRAAFADEITHLRDVQYCCTNDRRLSHANPVHVEAPGAP